MTPTSLAARTLCALLCGALPVAACDPAAPADADADATGPGGKADGGGIAEGTAEARAILRVANESSRSVLDDDVGLDARAAKAIVQARSGGSITTLAQLDAVSFVGRTAFDKLLAYAIDHGMLTRELGIATFNIRWYGLDGELSGTIGSESRDARLRGFIDEHLADHDVLVFEEIVDVARFEREVMFDRTCITYDGFTGKHQHLMLCHRDGLAFVPEADDTDFALEAVNLGGLRPALHGQLVDDGGTPVAHVIAVHLKAKEDSTAKRLEQARILSDRLDTLADADDVPVILIGDFNTHRADVTGLAQGDEALLAEILEVGDRVHRVDQGVVHTYRERNGVGFRLDQAWIDPRIELDAVAVPGPCNLDFATDSSTIVEYYDHVSDHCPLSLRLTLPR